MYAIVEIAGQQFKVQKSQRVYVHRLEASEGSRVEFDKVLLLENAGKILVGSPLVDGARVAAEVVEHVKGDKVIVFKKKRRKGYQKSNGHRQQFTQILIHGILPKGETLKAEDEAVRKPKGTPKSKTVESIEAEAAAKPVKKAAVKKAAPKKAAPAKKAPVKKAAPAKKAPVKKAAKSKE
jgi:large subunit ribosomal protein L21